jgi:hypothetical protein
MNTLLQDLLNLDKKKSTGTDNIGPKILKVSALVKNLLKVFSISIGRRHPIICVPQLPEIA